MNRLLIIFIFVFISSCGRVDFIYSGKVNLSNQLYERTNVTTSGINIGYIDSYIPVVFGESKDDKYNLVIEVSENKTKNSVEANQATSNLRYELRFNYTLISIEKDCDVYKKEILSHFAIIPKSEGYNFGTDTSLEKKYELVIVDNLSQFISLVSAIDLNNCQ